MSLTAPSERCQRPWRCAPPLPLPIVRRRPPAEHGSHRDGSCGHHGLREGSQRWAGARATPCGLPVPPLGPQTDITFLKRGPALPQRTGSWCWLAAAAAALPAAACSPLTLETSCSCAAAVLIKGGIWKNTEDEILKAAVMK